MFFKNPVTAYVADKAVSLFFQMQKAIATPHTNGLLLTQNLTPPLKQRANKANAHGKRVTTPRARRHYPQAGQH